MKCVHKPTEWELKFYGGCATCHIQTNHETNSPTQGSWTRATSIERTIHAKDILQPFKKDGTVNKQFVEVHGTQQIQKQLNMTDKAVRESVARYG